MDKTNCLTAETALFKDWFKEYHDSEIIIFKDGFMTYAIQGKYCLIHDMFVSKNTRGNRTSAKLADAVTEKAKEAGCTTLVGFVRLPSPYATISMKCQIEYGFKVVKAEQNTITLEKEI